MTLICDILKLVPENQSKSKSLHLAISKCKPGPGLKAFEELLHAGVSPLRIVWKSNRRIKVFLNNGSIANFVITPGGVQGAGAQLNGANNHINIVEQINIDSYLVGRIASSKINDILETDDFLVISFENKAVLSFVYYTKKVVNRSINCIIKLADLEPKIFPVCISDPGGTGSGGAIGAGIKLNRKLAVNMTADTLVVWWPKSTDSGLAAATTGLMAVGAGAGGVSGNQPSSSIARASPNVGPGRSVPDGLLSKAVLMRLSDCALQPLLTFTSNHVLLGVIFSTHNTNEVLTVEHILPSDQSTGGGGGGEPGGGVSKETTSSPSNTAGIVFSSFLLDHQQLNKLQAVRIAVTGSIAAHAFSENEERLAIAMDSGKIIMYTCATRSVRCAKTVGMKPALLAWHPSGGAILIVSRHGQIQILDLGLTPIALTFRTFVSSLLEDILNAALVDSSLGPQSGGTIDHVSWMPSVGSEAENRVSTHTTISTILLSHSTAGLRLVTVSAGVAHAGKLTPNTLTTHWLSVSRPDAAVALLQALSWDSSGQQCLTCLSAIVSHLLRLSLNMYTETLLFAAFDTFYSKNEDLNQVTILEYRGSVMKLLRRFFHQLLRHCRFEKAFLLAIDIQASDLFMDIYYAALDKGELSLATAAYEHATKIVVQMFNFTDSQLLKKTKSSPDHPDDDHKHRKGSPSSSTHENMAPLAMTGD